MFGKLSIVDWLKIISWNKISSILLDCSGLKSNLFDHTVSVLSGRPYTFLHLLETRQQVNDTKQNISPGRLLSTHICSMASSMGRGGLSVLLNVLKLEIEFIRRCNDKEYFITYSITGLCVYCFCGSAVKYKYYNRGKRADWSSCAPKIITGCCMFMLPWKRKWKFWFCHGGKW